MREREREKGREKDEEERRGAAARLAHFEAKSRLQKLFSRQLQKRRWAFKVAHCTSFMVLY